MAINNVRLNNAPVEGYSGTVTGPTGFSLNVKSWSASWGIPNVDTTLINDGVSYFDPVHVGPFSGSIVGQLVSGSPAMVSGLMNTDAPTLSSAVATITLQKETGHTLSFSGVVNQLQYTRNNVVGEVVMTFVASGPVNET